MLLKAFSSSLIPTTSNEIWDSSITAKQPHCAGFSVLELYYHRTRSRSQSLLSHLFVCRSIHPVVTSSVKSAIIFIRSQRSCSLQGSFFSLPTLTINPLILVRYKLKPWEPTWNEPGMNPVWINYLTNEKLQSSSVYHLSYFSINLWITLRILFLGLDTLESVS